MTGILSARLGILADRNFGCFWLARTLSLVGDYAFRVAFATYIISVSRSPSVLAAATAVLLLPSLVFYLVGGVVGDRAGSRRTIMIGADAARFVTLLAIAAATFWTREVWLLVALAVLIGVADGFFQPVSFAFIREIVRTEKLIKANSAVSVGQQIGLIGGPLLGGFLVGLTGASATFAFDALTFLASGGLLLLVRQAARPVAAATAADSAPDPAADSAADRAATGDRPGTPRNHLRQLISDVADAFRYMTAVQWLLVSIVVGACTNAIYAGVLDVAVPLILAPGGMEEAGRLGAFYTLQGVGALAGAAILVRLTVRRLGLTLYGMLALMAGSLAMVGVFGGGVGALAMACVYGVGLHFFNSLFPTVLHERVPSAFMSRVSSLAFLGFNGLMPLGALIMGPLAVAFTARGAAIVAGTVAAGASLCALLAPGIRRLTSAPPAADPAPNPAARP